MAMSSLHRSLRLGLGGETCTVAVSKVHLLVFHIFWLLIGSSCQSVGAQEGTGAGFDPLPVEISGVKERIRRPATNMDLLSIRDLHGLSLSPDGKYVAFILGQAVHATNSYRSGLFVVGTAPGAPLRSLGSVGPPHWTDYGPWEDERPGWSPDSQYVCYRMKTNGSWQVWCWSREGDSPSQLTHAKDDIESYRWISDGTKMVFTVKIRNDPEEVQRVSEHGILYDGTLSVVGGRSIVDRFLEQRSSEEEVWVHDVFTKEERRATEQEVELRDAAVGDLSRKIFAKDELERHRIIDAKVSPDGQLVAYKEYFANPTDFKRNTLILFSKRIRGGAPVQLSRGVPHMSQFWWNPNSAKIYYTENDADGHPSRLMVVDAAGGTPRQVYYGSDWLEGYSEGQAGHYVACTRQTGVTPPQVGILDLASGLVRVLVDVNPEFENLDLSRPTRIEGTNKYGDHWFAHLVKPLNYQAGRKYPLVITTYSSGDTRFLRGGTGDEYPIQVFAARGFAVLSFDTGTDRNFTPGDFQSALLQWTSPVASIEMAVRDLSENGIVDSDRVAITGFSHGAEMVEYVLSHATFIRAAIESGGGARDPYFYYIAGRAWQNIFSNWGLGGWPEGNSKINWQALSPVLNADHVSAPLLSNMADSEFIWGLALITSLQQLGKPVELFVYPNELHVKNQPKHRYEIYERNVDWLRFWLQGQESPDPAKSEQYARWRMLLRLTRARSVSRQ